MEIRFFHPQEIKGFLSNYFEYTFSLDHRKWRAVEHYYQAQKFAGTVEEKRVQRCKTPGGAKRYAHARKHLWRTDWDDVKVDVMRKAVQAKFSQSGFLARELLATGQATLIEDSPSDLFWGIGMNGAGKNMLGMILMETRVILSQENHDLAEPTSSPDR